MVGEQRERPLRLVSGVKVEVGSTGSMGGGDRNTRGVFYLQRGLIMASRVSIC